MERAKIVEKIISVLTRIQDEGGFEPVVLVDESTPLDLYTEFDSQIWVTAMTIILAELGIDLSLSENIFRSSDGQEKLNVGQVADRIIELLHDAKK